jgi:GNAT superfamily N-acetyltransferase
VRRAGIDDASEVARLAELMYRALGADLREDDWTRWRAAAATAVRSRLGADLEVVVVEDAAGSGHLVACGAATVAERLPNPWHAQAVVGYVQWMSTEPAFRRRGLARAVLVGLLGWLEARGVDNVELHASPEGDALYRSEGFWAGTGGVAMRRRPWDPPPA